MNIAGRGRLALARPTTWLLVLVAVCLAVASCGSTARQPASLRTRSCTVRGLAATCGTVTVPENRLAGTALGEERPDLKPLVDRLAAGTGRGR